MSVGRMTAEKQQKIRAAFYIGVMLALVPLVVLLTQVPWLLKVYHGPRPITAAELQQYGGAQPTDDYVAFEVSGSEICACMAEPAPVSARRA